VSSFKSTCR